ncbi:MAG TPA: orotidine 5'-phosphate decarboxylase / HUMPS family protein [Bryobacteraceae bacterium]|jgi:3-hexulose-6-phosphate synthase/6-phospho-3-hexuloisomerase|nr:orotidine 5'-phosphate decarboxylase / HUMPS family protein [Bryobacteraceae bacterium]
MNTTVQLSLDFIYLEEALETAALAIRAGVDWLEIGTPLVIAEGTRGIRELRSRYPDVPLVADLKMMDGGYGETQLAAKAGANMAVIMGQAHPESIEMAVKAGHDFGIKIMGDNMAMPDPVDGARRLEDLGCDYIVHHVGYDMRTLRRQRGLPAPTPLDHLRDIVQAVSIPVQAVGGLTLEQAVETPKYGAPMVVIGAPLVVKEHAFRTASGDLEGTLRIICERVHAYRKMEVEKEPIT